MEPLEKEKEQHSHRAGPAAGPGRQVNRGGTRVGRPGSRPRPAVRPEAHPRRPAGKLVQAGGEAGMLAEWAGLGAGPGWQLGRQPIFPFPFFNILF